MTDLISIVAPIFGLIGLGYGAAWARLFDQRGSGLSDYVFVIAIPALIFQTMSRATLTHQQPWLYWVAYFAGVALVWALAMVTAQKFFGAHHVESVIAGFCAAQANTVLIGVPLLLKTFGEAGAMPLFLLLAVHLPIIATAATMLIEGGGRADVWRTLGRLLWHPILLAFFIGTSFQLAGLHADGPVGTIIEALAASATPCALVALGVSLRRHGLDPNLGLAAVLTALKLIVHPALVYLFAFEIFPMPPVWAGVAVLFAAMPSGINSYLFAERYKTAVTLTSNTIALSTFCAVFTTVFWLWILRPSIP
jgi:malonate transporter and related proteins